MNDDPRYLIKNKRIEKLLKEIGRTIKGQMPKGWGFTLLIFTLSEGGQPEPDPNALFYLSSANREDMIKTMREFIARQRRPDVN